MASIRGVRRIALAGVVAVAAVAGAYLSDCVPGLGLGDGAPQPPSSTPPTDPAPEPNAASVFAIVVKGDRCAVDTASPPATDCEQLCTQLAQQHAGPGPSASKAVVIDATLGTHASVEALRKCLHKAGFERVSVHSE